MRRIAQSKMLPVMDMGYVMSCASRREYLRRIYARYQEARPTEKESILDEFCANCDYNRKYAIRLLNGPALSGGPMGKRRRRRGFRYGPRVLSILKAVWEAADYPWSVRLKALLPEWMPWIRRRYRLSAETERQMLQISPRSIDQRLRGEKRKRRRRLYGRTKPGPLLKLTSRSRPITGTCRCRASRRSTWSRIAETRPRASSAIR